MTSAEERARHKACYDKLNDASWVVNGLLRELKSLEEEANMPKMLYRFEHARKALDLAENMLLCAADAAWCYDEIIY